MMAEKEPPEMMFDDPCPRCGCKDVRWGISDLEKGGTQFRLLCWQCGNPRPDLE
jgi:hypothetical protein